MGTLVKVVIFSIICGIFTVLLGVRLANVRLFAKHHTYQAVFANATGVAHGDSVKIAGVDMGRVEGMDIEDGKAVLTFTLDQSIDLPADSRAAIRWRNVLGQRYLYVFPGTSDDILEPDSMIPEAQTEVAGDIGHLLNNLGPILKAIDPDKANEFLEAMNTALSGNELVVRNLIGNAAALATDLADMKDELSGTIEYSDEVLAVFADQDDALGKIFDDLESLGGPLERSTQDLNTVITEFSRVQKHLYDLASENGDNIDAVISRLGDVTGTLAANRRNLARTLCTLPMGVAGYWQTTSWGEWFNVRVTDVIIRDNESNTMIHEREAEDQRGDDGEARPAYDRCGGFYQAPGEALARESESAASASDGLDAIFRFATGGE